MITNTIGRKWRVPVGRFALYPIKPSMIMKKHITLSLILVLVVCGLATTWLVFNQNDPPSNTDEEEQIRDLLIEQITNYSHQSDTATRTSAAPIPKDIRNLNSADSPIFSSGEGIGSYTVVSVEPEMNVLEATSASAVPIERSSTTVRRVDWLQTNDATGLLEDQARAAGRDWSYGWIQIDHPLDLAQMQSVLKRYDATILGSSGDLVRLKLPIDKDRLVAIGEIPWVAGIGALPPELKTSPSLEQDSRESSASKRAPVFITVVDASEAKNLRKILERHGVVVGHFETSIRTFAAVIEYRQVATLSKLDFIQAIEPIEVVTATHDTAVQTMAVDGLRQVGQTFGSYTGFTGVSTPIAVMDTGLNINHVDLGTIRESICGENFISGEDSDLWFDDHGHGTHVTGTVAGNGYFEPLRAGMAPGVEHIRFAKVLSTFGSGSTFGIIRAMNFLGEYSSCVYDGDQTERIKPLVVNMSLSISRLDFDSRDTGARKLDSAVWTNRQLYTVSNANANESAYSNYAAAKNSLAIGSVDDLGDVAFTSSHGPTIDGRLLPSVMGTGVNVISAEGGGSYDTYTSKSGTSMSSPSVAGVAALLMDASPDHKENPALVRARLMASAIKPDAWFGSDEVFPKNNTNGPGRIQEEYGMGLVSARTTILNDDTSDGWTSSGAVVELDNGEVGYRDIVVPEGTSRLDVVMTWDEPATDTVANNVLNDLNLWIDYEADCGSEACGEYSSQSTIDNVEWVIIQNPQPGTYRLKVEAHRVYTDSPRAAVAWTVIRGDATPKLSVTAIKRVYETTNSEYHNHNVELEITSNSYVSSASRLHIDCRTLEGDVCGSIGFQVSDGEVQDRQLDGLLQREDGLGVEISGARLLPLGEIARGETQNVLLRVSTRIKEPIRVYFMASSWNGQSDSTSVVFRPSTVLTVPPAVAQPKNDSYAFPTLLEGQEGKLEIDALASAAEGGEPTLQRTERRPTGSIWFNWVAQESGIVTFLVNPRTDTSQSLGLYTPSLEVFDSSGNMAGSPRIGSSDWSVQFFAIEGRDYRVRIGYSVASIPLTLNWVSGERPANDNFANAIMLTGSSGEVAGNNFGATLEPGELYGNLASTVWYQWTAPEDGTWEFQMHDAYLGHILVFVGNSVSDLRLVSTHDASGKPINFSASEGQTFRIMVAAEDAYSGGWNYDRLSWKKVEDSNESNDMFRNATSLDDSESGSQSVRVGTNSNVEPNEPDSTGIQTRWFKWEAPSDGLFTWYWLSHSIHVAAYSGSALEELQPVVGPAETTSNHEFLVQATEGEEYWISVGRDKKEPVAFLPNSGTNTSFSWGETPSNNVVERAQVLSSHIGQLTVSSQYATTETDGRSHLGLSSLWYSREVTETGWVRFWVEGSSSSVRLAAYLQSSDSQELDLQMSSRIPGFFSNFPIEVYVYAEAGSRIILRVGNSSNHSSTQFVVRWAPSDPPQWLRYLGRIADGRRDASGNLVSLPNPRELTFNPDGSGLFVATDHGLNIYRRDGITGNLEFVQTNSEADPRSHLVWDTHRSRLYANHQDTWWTFAPGSEDTLNLELVGVQHGLSGTTTSNATGSPSLFLGKDGNFLYRSLDQEQTVFTFDEDGDLEYFGDFRVSPTAVYQAPNERLWFGVLDRDFVTFERRILGSPFFERLDGPDYIGIGGWSVASTYTGAYLIVPDEYGAEVAVYSVNRELGTLTDVLSEFFSGLGVSECWTALPRLNAHAVDVLCDRGAFVVEYDPDDGELEVQDNLSNNGFFFRTPDRWGRLVPPYSLTESVSAVASPDGRHIYTSTLGHGIQIFERVGNEAPEVSQDPDATDTGAMEQSVARRLDLIQASPNKIQFGDDSVTDGCIDKIIWEIDGQAYGVVSSKWQEREIGSDWVDIDGTSTDLEFCSYEPTENKEYRLVASMAIEGEINDYASNFFADLDYEDLASLNVASGTVTLNQETFSECTTVFETEINEVTYTVSSSKWQVRDSTDSHWMDVSGTHVAGGFCPYEPSDDREYRMVTRISIDSERSFRQSNIMTR